MVDRGKEAVDVVPRGLASVEGVVKMAVKVRLKVVVMLKAALNGRVIRGCVVRFI